MARHLWEIDHPYYCSESNYFDNHCYSKFESWESFLEEEGDSDLDMNLVFRFDWQPPDEGWEVAHHTLQLFYVGQRKGLFRCVEILVHVEDEDSICAWLKIRFDHMMKLWEPFGEVSNG